MEEIVRANEFVRPRFKSAMESLLNEFEFKNIGEFRFSDLYQVEEFIKTMKSEIQDFRISLLHHLSYIPDEINCLEEREKGNVFIYMLQVNKVLSTEEDNIETSYGEYDYQNILEFKYSSYCEAKFLKVQYFFSEDEYGDLDGRVRVVVEKIKPEYKIWK